MPRPFDLDALDDERAFWTGIDPHDLRALRRSPLDPDHGFALPDRLDGSAEVPAVAAVRAIARVIDDAGVPVAVDGSFDVATVRAIDALVAGSVPNATGEADVAYLRAGRQLLEALGWLERRKGRAHLTPAGRARLEGDADALLPDLFRAWAKRPLGRADRFAQALHASWPVTVLLLQRFGDRSVPAAFYAVALGKVAPDLVSAAPAEARAGVDPEEAAHAAFAQVYVADVLARFAAFFGLVELSVDADPDEGVEVLATDLLFELLWPPVEQAPASDAVPDWDDDVPGPAEAGVLEALREAMADQDFESEEEARAFVARFMDERNAAPVEDFDGLSPVRMQALLADPFGDASPLVVADLPRHVPRSPLLHLVLDLAEACGDDGLKATERGNLPRAYVRAALERYEAAGWGVGPYVTVLNEVDFGDLHRARVIARLAGLVTLRRGRWHATKALRTALARSGPAGVYAVLFRAVATKYAWNSADRYPELDIVQASWGFSLLQLLRHGSSWRPGAFYAERFARAFPSALDEVEDDLEGRPWWSSGPEQVLVHAYEVRVLERFAAWLGLAEVELGRTLDDYGRVVRVRATPALAEVVAERVG